MILSITNSQNFKGVYYNPNKFTRAQKNVVYQIMHEFRDTDYSNQNGGNYENNYEKKGIDFLLTPADDGLSVNLDALKKIDVNKLYVEQDLLKPSKSHCRIGTYNLADTFEIEELQKSSIFHSNNLEWKIASFIGFAFMLMIPFLCNKNGNVTINKNNITNVVKQVSDSIFTDTVKNVIKLK